MINDQDTGIITASCGCQYSEKEGIILCKEAKILQEESKKTYHKFSEAAKEANKFARPAFFFTPEYHKSDRLRQEALNEHMKAFNAFNNHLQECHFPQEENYDDSGEY